MNLRNALITASGVFLALNAMASGKHAGGHGDSAIGQPGVAGRVTRTVVIDMQDDMRFHSSVVSVRQGETIRFVAKNSGNVPHELVLGTHKDLLEHAELMKKHPEMEHDEPNMVTVSPGKRGEIIWQFTHAGPVDFACLQPGHFDAGMKGVVNVASRKNQLKGAGHVDQKH